MAKATTMGPMKIKESASYRVFKVFNAIILTLISVAMLYPFLYLVAQSFSSTEAIVAGEVGLIPKDFNISTYKFCIFYIINFCIFFCIFNCLFNYFNSINLFHKF